MKAYKIEDLLKKDGAALRQDLLKLKDELLELKISHGSRKNSDDTSQILKLRRQIARILTALSQKENQQSTKTVEEKKEK
jgi:ribosomal protein L29